MSGKIIIAGGTGLLGTLLSNAYIAQGWEVVVLGHANSRASGNARHVHWNGRTRGDWVGELEGATAVVNLAGRSINTRFTAKNKKEILDSRVLSTSVIGDAVAGCSIAPKVWINAGGVSIFGPSPVPLTEHDLPNGTDFLAHVSQRWEAAFADADTPATRKVQLRIGSVLLAEGGMLAPLVKLAKWGLGGTVGPGDQYVSWIHERDFVKLIDWLIEHGRISGKVHACSPHPVKNKDFMKAVRRALGVRFGLPSPEWATRIGAWLIGTEPELVLSGNRVVSQVLADEGFDFDFPELDAALRNLML